MNDEKEIEVIADISVIVCPDGKTIRVHIKNMKDQPRMSCFGDSLSDALRTLAAEIERIEKTAPFV